MRLPTEIPSGSAGVIVSDTAGDTAGVSATGAGMIGGVVGLICSTGYFSIQQADSRDRYLSEIASSPASHKQARR